MQRGYFEIDMLILEKCMNTPLRTSQVMKIAHSCTSAFYEHIYGLESLGLLGVTILETSKRSGTRRQLLSNKPQKYQRKLWKTTEKGIELVKLWRQMKILYYNKGEYK